MPHELPHWQTADQTWRAWRQAGPWRRIHEPRRDAVRLRMGRHPQPSAAIIEAQTVTTTGTGGAAAMMAPRHPTAASALASLTTGLLRRVLVQAADLREADLAPGLLAAAYEACARVQHGWAAMAYRGQRLRPWVEDEWGGTWDIVARPRR
jgi:putative transposase